MTQWFPRRCSVEQATHEWQDIQGRGPHGAWMSWDEESGMSEPVEPMTATNSAIRSAVLALSAVGMTIFLGWAGNAIYTWIKS